MCISAAGLQIAGGAKPAQSPACIPDPEDPEQLSAAIAAACCSTAQADAQTAGRSGLGTEFLMCACCWLLVKAKEGLGALAARTARNDGGCRAMQGMRRKLVVLPHCDCRAQPGECRALPR